MQRDSKLEVAAINIRIPEDKHRDYVASIKALADLRRGVRIHGDTYLAVSYFNTESCLGAFSKYTEIDIDGDWFDLDDFESAAPEKLGEIVIPDNLRPKHSVFLFQLNPELHVVAFSAYAGSRALSARSVGKYFSEALAAPAIADQFGLVESDILKSYGEVRRILSLPDIKELTIVISRPNSDNVGETLADIIEKRLREQNADTYEGNLQAKGKNSITPNERTQKLAQVAAENGHVKAKAVINGVLTPQNTDEQTIIERETYKPEERGESTVFQVLAKRILGHISSARAALQ
jgi:hypothetical protein